jgi:hypothetical protein
MPGTTHFYAQSEAEKMMICRDVSAQGTAATTFYGSGLALLSILGVWRATGRIPDRQILLEHCTAVEAKLWDPVFVHSRGAVPHAQFHGCRAGTSLAIGEIAAAAYHADTCTRVCKSLPVEDMYALRQALYGLEWGTYVHSVLGNAAMLAEDCAMLDLLCTRYSFVQSAARSARQRLMTLQQPRAIELPADSVTTPSLSAQTELVPINDNRSAPTPRAVTLQPNTPSGNTPAQRLMAHSLPRSINSVPPNQQLTALPSQPAPSLKRAFSETEALTPVLNSWTTSPPAPSPNLRFSFET